MYIYIYVYKILININIYIYVYIYYMYIYIIYTYIMLYIYIYTSYLSKSSQWSYPAGLWKRMELWRFVRRRALGIQIWPENLWCWQHMEHPSGSRKTGIVCEVPRTNQKHRQGIVQLWCWIDFSNPWHSRHGVLERQKSARGHNMLCFPFYTVIHANWDGLHHTKSRIPNTGSMTIAHGYHVLTNVKHLNLPPAWKTMKWDSKRFRWNEWTVTLW